MCMSTYLHVCMCTWVHVYTCACMQMCMCTHVHVQVHICTGAHVHICIQGERNIKHGNIHPRAKRVYISAHFSMGGFIFPPTSMSSCIFSIFTVQNRRFPKRRLTSYWCFSWFGFIFPPTLKAVYSGSRNTPPENMGRCNAGGHF